jgi:DNA mismatch endonuclease (patch repair protein)
MKRREKAKALVRRSKSLGERPPIPESDARSRIMRAIRSRDTAPELRIRSLVHQMGYRFRVCRSDLPGRPDLVFSGLKKIIFVHGCFWHGHDCGQGMRIPSRNTRYWKTKLVRTKARDAAARTALAKLGWEVTEIWECQMDHKDQLTQHIREFLGKDRYGSIGNKNVPSSPRRMTKGNSKSRPWS